MNPEDPTHETGGARRPGLRKLAWPLAAGAAFAVGLALPRPWGGGSAPVAAGPAGGSPTVIGASGGQVSTLVGPGGEAVPPADGGGAAGAAAAAQPALARWEIRSLAEEAFRDASVLKRSLAFAKMLEGLTPENAESMMEAMRDMGANGDQWEMFRYAWASKDGPSAIAYGGAIEGERERERFLESAVEGWASSDPEAAIAWVAGIEDEEERSEFTGNLVSGIADHDIDQAARYVYSLAEAGVENTGRFMNTVVSEKLRGSDVLSAVEWAERLPAGDLKGTALDRVASRYVDDDPESAARWAAQYAAVDYGVRVIEEVAGEWAERDPKASVAWLEALPEGRARDEGLQSAFNEWTDRDPRAASEFLASMPPSATRDRAINGFVGELSGSDPLSAVAWAEAIGQNDLRVEALTRAGRDWFRRDSAAATEWLASSNLPPEAQEAIVAPRRRRGR